MQKHIIDLNHYWPLVQTNGLGTSILPISSLASDIIGGENAYRHLAVAYEGLCRWLSCSEKGFWSSIEKTWHDDENEDGPVDQAEVKNSNDEY